MSKKPIPVASKIMVIRHAEKPITNFSGITVEGNKDPESVIVDGWQRAGALTVLFDPFNGPLQNSMLSTPEFLYAAVPGSESKSKRPVETITPLSQRLKLSINEDYGKDDYKAMANDAMVQSGVVLICWQHDDIAHIANHFLGKNVAPQKWPGDRFDVVWVFTLDSSSRKYKFSQVPQNLLAGDQNVPIT